MQSTLFGNPARRLLSCKTLDCGKLLSYETLRRKVTAGKFDGKNDLFWQGILATSCAVVDGNTGKLYHGKKTSKKLEIAGLTKIMACYTAVRLATEWNVNFTETYITIAKVSACPDSNFVPGDLITLQDLLYALILSGSNGPAVCIATFFGGYLHQAKEEGKMFKYDPCNPAYCKFPVVYFVDKMNEYAKSLGLSNTSFGSPHGYATKCNRSTAQDLGKLVCIAMKIPMISHE